MIPVTQDIFGKEGNCLASCVASIIERPLRDVPNFAEGNNGSGIWFKRLWDYCRSHGIEPTYWYLNGGQHPFNFDDPPDNFRTALPYHLMSGPAQRGFSHAVVGWRGTLVHDPHPSRVGLIEVTDYCFFLPAKK